MGCYASAMFHAFPELSMVFHEEEVVFWEFLYPNNGFFRSMIFKEKLVLGPMFRKDRFPGIELISNPEIGKTNVEKRGGKNSANHFQKPKSGFGH